MKLTCKADFCSNISDKLWKLLKLICLLRVIGQTVINIQSTFYSGKTVTIYSVINLDDVQEFPLSFNIIVKPGFDENKLLERGFASTYDYFIGRRNSNNSVIGWGGQGINSSNVKGEIKKSLFKRILIQAHMGKGSVKNYQKYLTL